jgi:hypothetical protein
MYGVLGVLCRPRNDLYAIGFRSWLICACFHARQRHTRPLQLCRQLDSQSAVSRVLRMISARSLLVPYMSGAKDHIPYDWDPEVLDSKIKNIYAVCANTYRSVRADQKM